MKPVMRLELVPIPVTDVDRSKAFYAEQLGFTVDHDITPQPGMRILQLTPPGSACSILLSPGLGGLTDRPGSVRGLHLVVKDLAGRGVAVGDVEDMGGVLYVWFSDPDGNTWALQEIPSGITGPR
jgi:catechol 2,3-dioxygenase-like lactoylglutathione lyase family enzyme